MNLVGFDFKLVGFPGLNGQKWLEMAILVGFLEIKNDLLFGKNHIHFIVIEQRSRNNHTPIHNNLNIN